MDRMTPEQRSRCMSKVKGINTKPEMIVRSFLHRRGFRFHLHRKDLSGKPDIVLPKYQTVIFVHGCFWHKHPGCRKSTIPKSNSLFWEKKLEENVKRDGKAREELEKAGWNVIVLWECRTQNEESLKKDLHDLLKKQHKS